MTKTIDIREFRQAFVDANREKFSYDGYMALFNWLEEDDASMELDVITICCNWSEYSASELHEGYGHILKREEWARKHPDGNDAMYIQDLAEALNIETTVVAVSNGGYLVMDY